MRLYHVCSQIGGLDPQFLCLHVQCTQQISTYIPMLALWTMQWMHVFINIILTCKARYFSLLIAYLWALLALPDDDEEMSEEKEHMLHVSHLKASVGMYHVCDYPYYSGYFWHCFTLQVYANVFYHYFFNYLIYMYYTYQYIYTSLIPPPESFIIIIKKLKYRDCSNKKHQNKGSNHHCLTSKSQCRDVSLH